MVMVNIRDDACSVHARMDPRHWGIVVAALAADPASIPELETAIQRFQVTESERSPLADLNSGGCWDDPDGVVVVDLTAGALRRSSFRR